MLTCKGECWKIRKQRECGVHIKNEKDGQHIDVEG